MREDPSSSLEIEAQISLPLADLHRNLSGILNKPAQSQFSFLKTPQM